MESRLQGHTAHQACIAPSELPHRRLLPERYDTLDTIGRVYTHHRNTHGRRRWDTQHESRPRGPQPARLELLRKRRRCSSSRDGHRWRDLFDQGAHHRANAPSLMSALSTAHQVVHRRPRYVVHATADERIRTSCRSAAFVAASRQTGGSMNPTRPPPSRTTGPQAALLPILQAVDPVVARWSDDPRAPADLLVKRTAARTGIPFRQPTATPGRKPATGGSPGARDGEAAPDGCPELIRAGSGCARLPDMARRSQRGPWSSFRPDARRTQRISRRWWRRHGCTPRGAVGRSRLGRGQRTPDRRRAGTLEGVAQCVALADRNPPMQQAEGARRWHELQRCRP